MEHNGFFRVRDASIVSRSIGALSLVLLFAAASALPARAQCNAWSDAFAGVGVHGSVAALQVFDDGSGPALYAGGAFTSAGDSHSPNLARWTNAGWSPVGGGVDGAVSALAVFDDGSGLALYAGGVFTTAGSTPVSNIAKWNGAYWSALAGGLDGEVRALAAFDDGSGTALYAGGVFSNSGSTPLARVARWNGSSWTSLGSGTNNAVNALCVHDDGSGSALYAGGSFTVAGGLSVPPVARWRAAGWSSPGSGLGLTAVRAFASSSSGFGAGPRLFAGGNSGLGGDVSSWNGSAWTSLAAGNLVHALRVFDDGTGPALYAGGRYNYYGGVSTGPVARWNTSGWSALPPGNGLASVGNTNDVKALAAFDDASESGPALFGGGEFRWVYTASVPIVLNNIARWHPSTPTGWSPLRGNRAPSSTVYAARAFDDGTGPALYIGGEFTSVAEVNASRVARWNGSIWSPVGAGLANTVRAFAVYDDGSGPVLYAGGAGGVWRWNGATWQSTGLTLSVCALSGFDAGMGPELFAADCSFNYSGSVVAWNGLTWRFAAMTDGPVYSLAVHDDGSGPELYFGGEFTSPCDSIASLDATGVGCLSFYFPGYRALAQAVFDDGSGPALYVGTGNSVLRWTGTTWTNLGNLGFMHALGVYDDGSGPSLFASGEFSGASATAFHHVARWNGASWSALGGGLESSGASGSVLPSGFAFETYDDGSGAGPALYLGGNFYGVDGFASMHLARWQGCRITSFCSGDGSLATTCPCGNFGAPGHGCAWSNNPAGALLEANGRIDPDQLVLRASAMPANASSTIFLKADASAAGGIVFGDGVRCADGALVRLGIKTNVNGIAQFPEAGNLPVSVRGATPPGSGLVGFYQTFFRNASATFCPPATFNLTNGTQIVW